MKTNILLLICVVIAVILGELSAYLKTKRINALEERLDVISARIDIITKTTP